MEDHIGLFSKIRTETLDCDKSGLKECMVMDPITRKWRVVLVGDGINDPVLPSHGPEPVKKPKGKDDCPEVIEELANGYEGSPNEMEELKVEPSDLGILGKIMKGYDLLVKGNKPGQVEFVLGDVLYSYIVTVKRHLKPLLINKNNSKSTTTNIIPQNIGRETGKGKSQELLIASPKKITVPSKTESVYKKVIVENVNDLYNTEPIEDFDNDSFAENDEIIFENAKKYVNEELTKQPVDVIDGKSFNIPLDSQMRYFTDFKESPLANTIVSNVKSNGSLILKCKLCRFMTEREDCLTAHIKIEHETESTANDNSVKKNPPDFDKEKEIIEKRKKLAYKKGVETKRKKKILKRKKALNEFIELLKNGTKFIKPFCDQSNDKEDFQDKSKEPSELVKCLFCSFTCTNRTELYRHIGLTHAHNPNEHYNEGQLKTDCAFCPFKGIHRNSLLLHLRTKHGQGKRYQCSQCDYVTHNSANFDRHIEVVHDKKRDIKCPECDFFTTRNYLLVKHLMKKHKAIKPYICPEPGCDFSSTSSSSRKAHIMEAHSGDKSHVCNIESCNFATSRLSILKNHLYKHHGIREPPVDGDGNEKPPFLCPHCPHETTQQGSLEKHIRIKHLGQSHRFKCDDCDFSARNKYFVKLHISEVHLGQYAYSCQLCEFKCSIKQRFVRHFNAVHLGQKPYQCESCDYKGAQQIHLQRHIEVKHRGEKPHCCVYCEFSTAHKRTLKTHLKSKHRVPDVDLNKVLLSCVDLRVDKRRRVKNLINEENNFTKEVVNVPETTKMIIEKQAAAVTEESHQKANIVTKPAIVTKPSIPQNNILKVDNIGASEASLVSKNIGQHQSLVVANSAAVEQSQRTNCLKPIQAVLYPQLTINNRKVYVAQQQNNNITPQEIFNLINPYIKNINFS